MRIAQLNSAFASWIAIALAIVGLTVSTPGCGPSQLSRRYDAYTSQVEPLLDQENARWNRVAELTRERRDDYALPRYYEYLQETALPFYTRLREKLAAVQPGGERLVVAHTALTHFVEARLEFVQTEIDARGLVQRATTEGGLLDVRSGLEEAENLRYQYMEAVKDDVADAKLGELYTAVASFRSKFFDPMEQGAADPEDVQVRLRQHVIPSLEALERRKYTDDDKGRLLKACVAAWLDWHRKLERACPLLEEVARAKARSTAATKDASESLTTFLGELEGIRRDR